MKFQVYSSMEWVYPDGSIDEKKRCARVDLARGGSDCFQILTDFVAEENEKIEYSFSAKNGCKLTLFQLLPAFVPENCGKELFTTLNYEEVKDFVTRQAPFDVYDVCRPIEEKTLRAGRVALFARIDASENAIPSETDEMLCVTIGKQTFAIDTRVCVHAVAIPKTQNAHCSQTNWLNYDGTAWHHGVEPWSKEHVNILKAYIENLSDIRNDYLMLPPGEPVYDESGKIVDFDFSKAELIGNLALETGMTHIMGGFAIRWKVWNLPDLFVKCSDLNVKEEEAQRQLRLYYKRCAECLEKNGWGDRYLQCVMDEVEVASLESYALVCKIVKEYLPNTKINDPVEMLEASNYVDVMVAKQVDYDSEREGYKKLQDAGFDVWVYTCAFPAGNAMKRILDLPLAGTRLPLWLCYKYGVKGFLCWGYNVHTKGFEKETCLPGSPWGDKGQAGDGFIVYPGTDGKPWYGVRAHAQRMAMEDFELLYALGQKDEAVASACVEKLCRNFTDYETSAEIFDCVRKELFARLDEVL